MKETKAARYVRLILGGQGVRQAARNAGFVHGVPSPHARRLHQRVLHVLEHPEKEDEARMQLKQGRTLFYEAQGWLKAADLARDL